jgi:hypothetical protein
MADQMRRGRAAIDEQRVARLDQASRMASRFDLLLRIGADLGV